MNKRLGLGILIVLMGFAIFSRYQPIFNTWGKQQVINLYGDGYKAYTVIQYHVMYDSTYTFFEGMNYPYQDHVIPAATQPFLSNTLKFFYGFFPNIENHIIDAVHVGMLFSLLLCGIFLYLIFKHWKLPDWYAIPMVIAISFLAPQTHRLFIGHYGLAHVGVIPATLYGLLLFDRKQSWWTSLFIALVLNLAAGIHFYFFAILVFLIAFFMGFHFLLSRKNNPRLNWWQYGLHLTLQTVLPFLLFTFWMNIGNPPDDRPTQPWGFFHYKSNWAGIVTSPELPLYRWLKESITIPYTEFEGHSYIGLVAIAFLAISFLIALGKLIPSLRKFKFIQNTAGLSEHHIYIKSITWAATLCLTFSFGLPFIFKGFEFLLNYTGPVKQFRSIGRFAWVFYFVINLVAVKWWFEKSRSYRYLQYLLPLLLIGIISYESYQFTYSRHFQLQTIPRYQTGQQFTDLGIDFNNYQAILTAPYYTIGSDNVWESPEGYILNNSLTLSVQTGLATTSSMLTRLSVGQTYEQLQAVYAAYRTPKLLGHLPTKKPFLLMTDEKFINQKHQFGNNSGNDYRHLTKNAKLLYDEQDRLKLYELPLSAFDSTIAQTTRYWQHLIASDSLVKQEDYWSSDSTSQIVYHSFNQNLLDSTYMGSGAYTGNMNQNNIVFDQPLSAFTPQDSSYIFSIWMYVAPDMNARTHIEFKEYTSSPTQPVQHRWDVVYKYIKIIDDNGWALIEFPFHQQISNSHILFSFKNHQVNNRPIYLDECLIRPVGVDFYRELDKYVWKNNRWLEK